MRARRNLLLKLILTSLVFAFSFSCSSSKDEEDIPEYLKNVEVLVELGPSSDLTDMGRDDLFFTVRNSGDKTIKELKGDIVFYITEGEEAGRVSWIFVQENDAMLDIALGEKKDRWRPLPPGDELVLASDKVIFFSGDDRPLQEKLEPHWDSVEAQVDITGLVAE
jgi:hypothetical protein